MKKSSGFHRLLSSFKVKTYLLRNRVVFAPMSTQMAHTDGSVSDQMLDYYGDKAICGAAIVITETFHVDNKASRFTYAQPSIYHDRFVPGLSNAGRQTTYEVNNHQPVAPSRILGGPTHDCHELTKEEIDDLIMTFADAASRAAAAGFDGIEIHGGNGYLINEFLSPYTNRRNDEYGKSKELFLTGIIDAVSSGLDDNLILGVRIGFSDFVNGGLEPPEAIHLCSLLPHDKVDYIHTSAGTNESDDYRIQPAYQKRALLRDLAKDLKKRIRTPVILTGSINNPFLAEELLAGGHTDLIGMGRPLLADPMLPKKVMNPEGDQVRPCIRCNQGCLARVRLGKTIRCAVNPQLGYERSIPSISSHESKGRIRRVLIAGAGPAGITAALRAKELGFAVRLFERGEHVGGLLDTAKHEEIKQDLSDYLAYLTTLVSRSGVEVIRSTKVDPSLLREENPDILIDATGSVPIMPSIPKRLPYMVVEVRSILANLEGYFRKQRVVIIGGGSVGCELGYTLASQGEDVTIVEQESDILVDIDPVSALTLRRLLEEAGVTIRLNTRFVRFEREGVIANEGDEPVTADLFIIAMGSRPNDELGTILKQGNWRIGKNYLCIGDARRVGRIYEAVNDSYWTVSSHLSNY
jgi:2,4-dienoyl-CoA reductase-like NADH-dependent reductase (Old Yellow Enzyme family)/thioredoxin reductase